MTLEKIKMYELDNIDAPVGPGSSTGSGGSTDINIPIGGSRISKVGVGRVQKLAVSGDFPLHQNGRRCE